MSTTTGIEKLKINVLTYGQYEDEKTQETFDENALYLVPEYNIPAYGDTPPGAVMQFAGSTAPSGWLVCDGASVSKETYPLLFEVIGTTYGGDGNPNFNLPNCGGRVIQGVGTLEGNTYALGQTKSGGLPNITGRVMTSWGDASGGGIIMQGTYNSDTNALYSNADSHQKYYYSASLVSTSSEHHNVINIDASKSSDVYGNSTTVQPPSLVLNYIIKY